MNRSLPCEIRCSSAAASAATESVECTLQPMTRYESLGDHQRCGEEVNSIVTAPSSDDERGATCSSWILSVALLGSGTVSLVGRLNSEDIFDCSLSSKIYFFEDPSTHLNLSRATVGLNHQRPWRSTKRLICRIVNMHDRNAVTRNSSIIVRTI